MRELAEQIVAGDRRALARAITTVESTRPDHREEAAALLTEVLPHTGGAIRIGISGAPGSGKSTFIEAFGLHLVEHGHRVAVLAVDPSSTRTGGSILGDKTRMGELTRSDSAFVRPSPTAGTLGGVARRTGAAGVTARRVRTRALRRGTVVEGTLARVVDVSTMPLRTRYVVSAGTPSSDAVNFDSSGRHGSLTMLMRGSKSRVPTLVAPPGRENALRPSSALRASNDMPPESRRSATACASSMTG